MLKEKLEHDLKSRRVCTICIPINKTLTDIEERGKRNMDNFSDQAIKE